MGVTLKDVDHIITTNASIPELNFLIQILNLLMFSSAQDSPLFV